MRDINNICIGGRLTAGCKYEVTRNGTGVAKFTVAVNDAVRRNDEWEDETSFVDCVIFGKLAECAMAELSKGMTVTVSGKLRQERWEKDGQKHSRVYVLVDNVRWYCLAKVAREAPASDQGSFQGDDIPF